jgi:hypothetical protein
MRFEFRFSLTLRMAGRRGGCCRKMNLRMQEKVLAGVARDARRRRKSAAVPGQEGVPGFVSPEFFRQFHGAITLRQLLTAHDQWICEADYLECLSGVRGRRDANSKDQ